jgi:hypothetical protein
MIKISVEVREGATFSRVAVQADTISQAVSITKLCHPGRDVRVVFPIDPEGFFAGDPKKTAAFPAGNTKNSSRMRLLPDRIR